MQLQQNMVAWLQISVYDPLCSSETEMVEYAEYGRVNVVVVYFAWTEYCSNSDEMSWEQAANRCSVAMQSKTNSEIKSKFHKIWEKNPEPWTNEKQRKIFVIRVDGLGASVCFCLWEKMEGREEQNLFVR